MGARGALPKVRTSPHAPLFLVLLVIFVSQPATPTPALVGCCSAASITTRLCVESLDILECSYISVVGC